MVFSTIAQIIGVSAGLMTPVALPVTCNITQPPIINISPTTDPIQYDTSKTSAELTAMKSNTISPYGLNVDQTTGGLRQDKPTIETKIKFGILTDPNTQTFCMSYAQIDINIKLQPKIYIAQEYNTGECGRMVLGHEKKHVTTDRWVINKYSNKMGQAILGAVNSAKVIGPFPVSKLEETKELMQNHIISSLDSVKLVMMNEMNIRQQHVDSLEEYERVGQYCQESAETVFKKKYKK